MPQDAAPPAGPPPNAPNDAYGMFVGLIDQQSLGRITSALAIAGNSGITHLHLAFQSTGGTVGDGIALYSILRAVSFDVTLYNVGQISSIAVVAYLGAKQRKCSTYANFMVHRTTGPALHATAERWQATTRSLMLDDERTEAIFRAHLNLSDSQWETHKVADLWITATEAEASGLVTEIGDFAPEKGKPLFNI